MPVEHDAIPTGPRQPAVSATTIEGPPENVEQTLQLAHGQLLALYEQQPGWCGTLALVTFDRRRSILLSFWESEAALREGSVGAGRFGDQVAALGVTITSTDRFEILFDERVE